VLPKILNLPLTQSAFDQFKIKKQSEIDQEEQEKENERKRVSEMDDLQKRRYDRE
jgi:hypothetical protein